MIEIGQEVNMELNKQIKKYRKLLNLSQEELAEKVFVTRQTISNWENNKSYPDIHSLLLLSKIFNVSLDQLIKGDIDIMKEEIKSTNVKNFNLYGGIFGSLLIITVISTAPLVYYFGSYGFMVLILLLIIMLILALKVEKYKKDNNIQTYKEIVAYLNGQCLDEITANQEKGKRPYQKFVLALIAGIIAFIVIMLSFGLLEILN